MDIFEVPKVLFIKGVFKHTARSIQEVIEAQPAPVETPLEPLLQTYEDWNDQAWMGQREIKCATCPRKVGKPDSDDPNKAVSRQIFVPESIERKPRGTAWKPHNTARFCCWPCAQYHIVYFLKNDSRFVLLLKHLYQKWTDKPVDEIAVGEHPWHCIEMGGNRTIDELHRINDFNMARLQNSFQTDTPEEDEDEDD